MGIGGLGPMELTIILVIVLVVFGARKVPEIGASIGKGIREFKRNISDVDRQIRSSDDDVRPRERIAGGDRDEAVTQEAQDARAEPRRLI